MSNEEILKVYDSKRFHYEVLLKYYPNFGFSIIYYKGKRIGSIDLYKIHKPIGDNDLDWERYEELYSEWADEIKINAIIICKEYFDSRSYSNQ